MSSPADKIFAYYSWWEISPVVHSGNWVLWQRDRYLRLGLDSTGGIGE
jgi:hypothetical protein